MTTVMPPEIAALMGSSVLVEYEASGDMYGKKTYTTRGTFDCYPVEEARKVYSLEGREDVSSLTLYVNTDTILATDRITYRSAQYKMLALQTWRDDNDSVWGQVLILQ